VSITIACPTCHSRLQVGHELAGKQVQCQQCSQMLLVPSRKIPVASFAPPAAPKAPAAEPVELNRFLCPVCNAVMEAPAHKVGQKIACLKCGQRLQIPHASANAPKPQVTILAKPLAVPAPPSQRPPSVPVSQNAVGCVLAHSLAGVTSIGLAVFGFVLVVGSQITYDMWWRRLSQHDRLMYHPPHNVFQWLRYREPGSEQLDVPEEDRQRAGIVTPLLPEAHAPRVAGWTVLIALILLLTGLIGAALSFVQRRKRHASILGCSLNAVLLLWILFRIGFV